LPLKCSNVDVTRGILANLRIIMHKAKEHQQPLYMCFIDFRKAFNKEKETHLLWTYHEETRQPGEGHYNGDFTRKTGKIAEDVMNEQHYCMDWANVEWYIEEDRGKK